MYDLKVHVERIVRPIRASPWRKDRMREELVAHLTATYQEEFARDGHEAASLTRALERFGKPEQLRRALQDSVPRVERILCVRFPYPAEWYIIRARRRCTRWPSSGSSCRRSPMISGRWT